MSLFAFRSISPVFRYLFPCTHTCSSFQLNCPSIYTHQFSLFLCQIVMCLDNTFQRFSACLFCVSTLLVYCDFFLWICLLFCFWITCYWTLLTPLDFNYLCLPVFGSLPVYITTNLLFQFAAIRPLIYSMNRLLKTSALPSSGLQLVLRSLHLICECENVFNTSTPLESFDL